MGRLIGGRWLGEEGGPGSQVSTIRSAHVHASKYLDQKFISRFPYCYHLVDAFGSRDTYNTRLFLTWPRFSIRELAQRLRCDGTFKGRTAARASVTLRNWTHVRR